MNRASFDTIVTTLTQDQTPRVWSFLVSVFGDLAQQEDAQISGALLRQLTERIGIKPEAVRVAIHRLRKEGWIDSRRSGRTSVYFLTPWGRTQSAQASPRIYSADEGAERAWLVLFNPAKPAPGTDDSGAWISSNMLITSVKPKDGAAFASALTADTPVPGWMTSKVCETPTVLMSQDFATALDGVARQLDPMPMLQPVDIAALRVLLVHSWRRILLRTPILPDHVFPDGWCGADCRAKVAELLARYPNPGLQALEADVDAPTRDTP
ncbi:PaaX family transcriptional regulator [Marivita sp. S6314]|uniref:PaaX family transcriptional regulator C-terminal domain-containing protein n=1 Tax=Marivita sp. S6314 TaxID=2926406 RepID=UPI001FF33402|nr:PaaX family transcriptional regulator C-terminal domain-containing protein [Marivita sp. S6314]MCK0151363.1 PaaX family transcriptional regulator [Marivita sp. S6314]